ncbi:MAG: aminoglycoside phosphotransferase family protein [Spirochaetales bacterium]|nr:aminoglycoside phosphotransferase family protein [Spirochaetales bacterium]
MKSNTKYELDHPTVSRLFKKAGIENIHRVAHLGNGEFNSVYSAEADGKSYALKVAPLKNDTILTYEQDMMAQEVFYYSVIKENTDIRIPEVYYSDFSCTDVPTPWFIMERLKGTQLDETDFTREQTIERDRKLAAMAASLHSVKGEGFGYRQNGLRDSWYAALGSMVENLIHDGERLGKKSRNGRKLLRYIRLNKDLLEQVESRLINFDIWPANIICSKKDEDLQLAWIDPERCLWGDRIADFVCLDFNRMSLLDKKKIREFYNAVSDQEIGSGRDEEIRYALMLAYLGLIMEIEKYARYTVFHFGWWRNVFVCHHIFKNAFRQLKLLSLREA